MTDKNLQVEDQLPLEPPANTAVEQNAAPDPTIEELKRQIAEKDKREKAALETADAERRRADEAARVASERDREVEQYRTQAQTAEQRAVANAIDAATRESESAQHEYETAMNAADYAAAGKAQAKIARATAHLVQLENAKAAFDAQAAARTAQSHQVRVDVSRQVDPTEQFLSAFSPRTQGWLRSHRDLIVSGQNGMSLSNKALAQHHAALAEGIEPESDEYFAFIDERLAPKQQQATEDDDPPPAPAPRRAAPVAAPVSRDPPGSNQRPSRIRLSPEQVEAARIAGVSEAQYAEHLMALKAEGRIGRTTH